MPHISVKMLKGRTEEQKKRLACELQKTLIEVLGCGSAHISVAIEDFTAQEWQEVFENEIDDNKNIYIKPSYDPKDLL